MKHLIISVTIAIIFSLYYFPFEFTFLPGINTKMMLAVIGLLLVAVNCLKKRAIYASHDIIGIVIISLLYSLFSYCSVVYNNTSDLVYAHYFISMAVWLSAAYTIVTLIKQIHGEINMQLIFHYMAIVCAAQAILGIIIDNMPSVQQWVDTYVSQDQAFLHRVNRLYGIGASFDTAGIRFSCALVGLGYLLTRDITDNLRYFYIILWLIIVVLGNIMSRTTLIGAVASICYITIEKISLQKEIPIKTLRIATGITLVIAFVISIAIYCYNTIPEFRNYLQYGFEGFFNFFETGDWSTDSTDKLKRMVIFPDNTKTWLVGDGWFDDPSGVGFYMSTDVGYLRLIFYSGIIGLVMFSSLFFFCTAKLSQRWSEDKALFYIFLILQGIVWIKISTDIFLVYALLVLLPKDGNKTRTNIFEI